MIINLSAAAAQKSNMKYHKIVNSIQERTEGVGLRGKKQLNISDGDNGPPELE